MFRRSRHVEADLDVDHRRRRRRRLNEPERCYQLARLRSRRDFPARGLDSRTTTLEHVSSAVDMARGPDGWENWRAFERGEPGQGETVEFSYYTDSHLTAEVRQDLGPYELLNTVPAG